MDERMHETPGENVQAKPDGAGFGEKVSEEARDLSAKASAAAERGRAQAKHYGGMLRTRLMKQADSRKGHLASELENLAGTLDNLSTDLGERGRRSQEKMASQGAGMLRKASSQLRDQSSEQLVTRAEDEFKARPGVFLAGMFAIGFLGARLLRS